ncbi:MAG TPA: flagellar hook capping FlgD N-terminal domain-containing protein [Xanthobacteraceae bacterium]|jgi:flagellar basal-body rod modification protein FlgD|nr:flagellar hook capping FlgD N-terminal domain-containing protein [Xanthobacteraceae bacterium]
MPTIPAPTSATVTQPTSSTIANSTGVTSDTLAGNFQTFLTLLTTQLQNQNPLDPLDTNQFTAQLVQFAQVEQQLRSNDQLSTLVSLQQTAQATAALNFVGQTVGVSGATTALSNGSATWNLTVPKPATGTITVTSATGQTVYSGNYTMTAGTSPFVWDGKDNSGQQWPDGNYTITVTAQDASGQLVAIPTEIQATVDSVDMSKTPPTLSIAGQDYTLDKIKRVVRN